MPAVCIVMPVYRDVESFVRLRERLLEVFTDSSWGPIRFAVCDDTAGLDPEMSRLEEFEDTIVIRPPFNLGHQRALVYALRQLRPVVDDDWMLVTMDADGDDQPEDVPRLLQRVPADGVAIAQRTQRQETWLFRAGYWCFTVLFRALTGESLKSGNFAAARAGFVKPLLVHPYFDLSYSATIMSLDLPVAFVPCARGKRYFGRSRMGWSRLVRHGMAMLVPFTDRIAFRALTLFSSAIALSILVAMAVLGIRFFTDAGIPGWATSTLLLLLVLSFVALGNVVVLFAVFSQSRGLSFANLELSTQPIDHAWNAARGAPPGPT